MRFILLTCILGILCAQFSIAGETKFIQLTKKEDFLQGEDFKGLILTSKGELKLGLETGSIKLKNEPSIWCGTVWDNNTIFTGTGTGKIYRVDLKEETCKLAFETKEMLVTSLLNIEGEIYASTIPNGKIFVMKTDLTWSEFTKLDCKYIWQMIFYDGSIYAVTGQPACLYKISADGSSEKIYEAKADNILCISAAADGSFIIGTSNPGYLIKVKGERGYILHDFQDNEVKAVVVTKDAIYAGVNSGTKLPPFQFLNAVKQAQEQKQPSEPHAPQVEKPVTEQSEDMPLEIPAPSAQQPVMQSSTGGSQIKGTVWKIRSQRSEPIVEFSGTYITNLAMTRDGLFATTNSSGRVFRLLDDGSYELYYDFKSNQSLGFVTKEDRIAAVLLGNRGELGMVSNKRAKKGSYLSKVFDTTFQSKWGQINAVKDGDVVIKIRTGNTANPQDGWSSYSEPIGEFPAMIPSERGRYIQFKVILEGEKATLKQVTLAYKNENQRPRIQSLKIEYVPVMQPVTDPSMMAPPMPAGPSPRLGQPHSALKRITWQAADSDGDALSYRLFYRAINSDNWIPLHGQNALRMNMFQWNTETIPDGRYIIRVVASDEVSNVKEEVLTDTNDSEALIIDNGKPEVKIAESKKSKVSGVAQDNTSNIVRIEYQVDGGEWRTVIPNDSIFDNPREEFEFQIDSDALKKGTHTITIRAYDQEMNVGLTSTNIEVG